MEKLPEQKRFSLVARVQSSNDAWRGFLIFLRSTHNAWMHFSMALLAIYLGYVLAISSTEWILLIFTIGLVILSEMLNTAIEIDIDLTSPTYHPYARDTKDVAAGAVLVSVFIACIVGIIIFLPKILALL